MQVVDYVDDEGRLMICDLYEQAIDGLMHGKIVMDGSADGCQVGFVGQECSNIMHLWVM